MRTFELYCLYFSTIVYADNLLDAITTFQETFDEEVTIAYEIITTRRSKTLMEKTVIVCDIHHPN